jgi:hypothetical protein
MGLKRYRESAHVLIKVAHVAVLKGLRKITITPATKALFPDSKDGYKFRSKAFDIRINRSPRAVGWRAIFRL